jgi:spermidine synthase
MWKIVVRATLAAFAFLLAVQVVPEIAWFPRSTVRAIGAVVVVVGCLNGVLPPLFGNIFRSPSRPAVALAAIVLNVVIVIGLVIGSRFANVGIRLGGLPGRPADSILAIAITVVLSALPLLAEVALQGKPLAWPATYGLRAGANRRLVVLAIFVLSGAAGLMYEVVWSRQLVLVFGNTTQAVSAILTGYFGGIAIGSIIGGRLADRVGRPLRMYAALELVLVVVVLATPALFRGLHEVYRSSYGALESFPTTLALIRYALAVLALAPATVLMGATLPTLTRYLSRSAGELGGAFGRLYAANTIGAVAGTIIAGLLLIELVGLHGTLVVGALASAAAGIAAIVLDVRWAGSATPGAPYGIPDATAITAASASDGPRSAVPPPADPEVYRPSVRNIAIAVAFVSGLTSLGYQVLWTRLLASGSGNATYVFTLILATFLVGLSVGAAYVARRPARASRFIAWVGVAQLAAGATALAGIPILAADVASTWPLVFRVLLVVLPGTLALGVTLPMVSHLIGLGRHRLGRDAGLLLCANTVGAISGTFLVPFIAVPVIGSPRAVVLLAFINALLGVALLAWQPLANGFTRRAPVALGAVLAGAAALGLIMPNRLVVDPGTSRMSLAGTVYAAKEDEIAAVQAGIVRDRKRLFVGGNGMTALTVDAKLMALMPEFVRPSARRMLVIAFGMGSSYRSGLISGLTVDGVELVPSVPEMFGYFYSDAGVVLANPRGRVIVADGRNYLELTKEQYDIIVVDPPPPIESSGTAVLYSREFYLAAAARLTPQGVMMEWMPGGQSVDEFRAHVRTFASVYPNVLLAFGPATNGVYMLGSAGPTTLESTSISTVLSRTGVVRDLDEAADAPVTSHEAWQSLIPTLAWIEGSDVARFGGSGPLITDDRPLTEYFLLRRALGPKSPPANGPNLLSATR